MTDFEIVDRCDIVPKRTDHYASFPGMTRTASGDILLAYRDGRAMPGTRSHGIEGDLVLMRFAGGRWSEPQVLYPHEGDVEEMGCGDLTCTADGTLILWSRRFHSREYRTLDSCFAASRDDGCTFSPRRPVRFEAWPNAWTPYGKLIELDDGRWLQGGYGRRAGEETSSAACLVSTDRGDMWAIQSWIAEAGDGRGLNYYEPFVYRLPDGALYALLRTNGMFYAARSTDLGLTWTAPEPAFRGMACAGLVLSSGELLVTYRGIHEAHPDRNTENVTKREGRLYCFRVSSDDGRTWGHEAAIDDGTAWQIGSYGMGDVLELERGRVLVVYYTSDTDQAPWLAACTLEPH